ncbi:unnamed protein product [Prorocentrum cordatum]|uniref:Non-specific serine/threonine protein kinase n=1 Tax=Prorocentrum cordatum TaxID=2364126 RepID=A0ABN9VP85_9DINO|nr:unnamed protein product [Polarella glacialis]
MEGLPRDGGQDHGEALRQKFLELERHRLWQLGRRQRARCQGGPALGHSSSGPCLSGALDAVAGLPAPPRAEDEAFLSRVQAALATCRESLHTDLAEGECRSSKDALSQLRSTLRELYSHSPDALPELLAAAPASSSPRHAPEPARSSPSPPRRWRPDWRPGWPDATVPWLDACGEEPPSAVAARALGLPSGSEGQPGTPVLPGENLTPRSWTPGASSDQSLLHMAAPAGPPRAPAPGSAAGAARAAGWECSEDTLPASNGSSPPPGSGGSSSGGSEAEALCSSGSPVRAGSAGSPASTVAAPVETLRLWPSSDEAAPARDAGVAARAHASQPQELGATGDPIPSNLSRVSSAADTVVEILTPPWYVVGLPGAGGAAWPDTAAAARAAASTTAGKLCEEAVDDETTPEGFAGIADAIASATATAVECGEVTSERQQQIFADARVPSPLAAPPSGSPLPGPSRGAAAAAPPGHSAALGWASPGERHPGQAASARADAEEDLGGDDWLHGACEAAAEAVQPPREDGAKEARAPRAVRVVAPQQVRAVASPARALARSRTEVSVGSAAATLAAGGAPQPAPPLARAASAAAVGVHGGAGRPAAAEAAAQQRHGHAEATRPLRMTSSSSCDGRSFSQPGAVAPPVLGVLQAAPSPWEPSTGSVGAPVPLQMAVPVDGQRPRSRQPQGVQSAAALGLPLLCKVVAPQGVKSSTSRLCRGSAPQGLAALAAAISSPRETQSPRRAAVPPRAAAGPPQSPVQVALASPQASPRSPTASAPAPGVCRRASAWLGPEPCAAPSGASGRCPPGPPACVAAAAHAGVQFGVGAHTARPAAGSAGQRGRDRAIDAVPAGRLRRAPGGR